jgi:thiosulfate/3-mercaptopyruvate sulfurtransferase
MKYFLVMLLLVGTLVAKVPDVVSLGWLKEHYNDSSLVLIDVRDKKLFKKDHLEKAVSVPALEKLFHGSKLLLPSLSSLKKLFSQAGIDENSKIVIYGGVNPIWSARFYWISKLLGADNVGVLKVSFGNWKKDEFPISKKMHKPRYSDFVPKINNRILKTKLDILTSVDRIYLIDGRPFEFYVGKKSHAKKYGHIPKAFNLPGSLTYEKNGTKSVIKNFETLKKLYIKLPHDKPIVLYCEDGADAAMNFLVLKKLGYDASVYDGSWLEWGNDKHLPIETKVNKL